MHALSALSINYSLCYYSVTQKCPDYFELFSLLPQAVEIPKRSKVPRDELNDLDWWSRYYVSLKDLRTDTAAVDKVSDLSILA